MHSTWLQFGALLALAQFSSAVRLHIENTNPPANKYITHCTLIVDGNLHGCVDASSEPFVKGCGGNTGTATHTICNSAAVTIDWDTLKVTFDNNAGDHSECTLDTDQPGGECDMP